LVSGGGFSLIELLVVISMLGILVAISFPFLSSTLQNNAINAAQGQVSNALSAARVYATQNKPFVAARTVGSSLRNSDDNGDGYSGAIALFAPDNTIRIMANDENAYDDTGALTTSAGWLELQVPPLNGYAPIDDFEDITFPTRVQALGLVRTGPNPYDVQLVPPPFAIRMASDGTIAQGTDDNVGTHPAPTAPTWDRVVYVSSTGSPPRPGSSGALIEGVVNYDINLNRDGFPDAVPATPAVQDIDLADYGYRGSQRMDDGRVQLPIGVIETVVGVLLVEPERVPEQFAHPGTATQTPIGFDRERFNVYTENQSAALLNWAQDNGTYARILLFNPYTGQDLTR
jgi:prepilin-type N-terminal cleavage/methylation domain-containing protein